MQPASCKRNAKKKKRKRRKNRQEFCIRAAVGAPVVIDIGRTKGPAALPLWSAKFLV